MQQQQQQQAEQATAAAATNSPAGGADSGSRAGGGGDAGDGTRLGFSPLGLVAREVNCANELWMALVLTHAAVQGLAGPQLAAVLSAGKPGALSWAVHGTATVWQGWSLFPFQQPTRSAAWHSVHPAVPPAHAAVLVPSLTPPPTHNPPTPRPQ